MKVFKFGGTSVGSVANMRKVKEVISAPGKKIVVLSAMSGTTDALVELAGLIREGNTQEAESRINTLEEQYLEVARELLPHENAQQAIACILEVTALLRSLVVRNYSDSTYRLILAQGELLSTRLFTDFLVSEAINAHLLPALEFMRIDKALEPDEFYIRQNLKRIMDEAEVADIYITQGFICRDAWGEIANLQRGGSDYTATIIGAIVGAEEVQIWTDIDGMHNNDPRVVEGTHAISRLSFDEAAELAYFGAKILHPQTVMPAREADIPVRLKHTMRPGSPGTLISGDTPSEGVKAIAAKDGITAIKIKSARMLQAHGFLKRVFEVFEKYETPIDMITTSEIAVSLTVDDPSQLETIVPELEAFSTVEVDRQQTIICLVGHSIVSHQETHRLFQVLQDLPVRMISYGGSKNNISLLVSTADKVKALRRLNEYVF
jgi:aspartate kinase